MRFSSDRLGFPFLRIEELDLGVQLLPVTKLQFERFLAEPNAYGDSWYEAALAINPRVSSARVEASTRERVFTTGVLPEEALDFARWIGPGYDLPTVAEWRAIRDAVSRLPDPAEVVSALRRSLGRISDCLPTSTVPEFMLMEGGLVEWVRDGAGYAGLGAPRPESHPNLWRPMSEVVRPIRPTDRLPYFGFRLVKRGTP